MNGFMHERLVTKNQRCENISEKIGAKCPVLIYLTETLTKSESRLPLLNVRH